MAKPTQSSPDQINSWLTSKDYKSVVDAISAQQKDSGKSSAWQESALATAEYFLKDYGAAVIHSQNAVLLDRWNSNARNNLAVAQEAVEGGLGKSMSHPANWGFELSTWIRPKESLSLAFLLLNIFLLLRFFKKPHLKRDLGFGFFIVAMLMMSGIGFYGTSIGVIAQNTTIKQQPISSAPDTDTLPAGARVRMIRASGDFIEIERSGSHAYRGWIPKETLKLFY